MATSLAALRGLPFLLGDEVKKRTLCTCLLTLLLILQYNYYVKKGQATCTSDFLLQLVQTCAFAWLAFMWQLNDLLIHTLTPTLHHYRYYTLCRLYIQFTEVCNHKRRAVCPYHQVYISVFSNLFTLVHFMFFFPYCIKYITMTNIFLCLPSLYILLYITELLSNVKMIPCTLYGSQPTHATC